MKEGIAFAHEHGVKVYVTVNILAHNYDLPGVREYLTELKELKPDALIIADRESICMQRKYARKSNAISVHRQTILTMRHIVSGTIWEQSVW